MLQSEGGENVKCVYLLCLFFLAGLNYFLTSTVWRFNA